MSKYIRPVLLGLAFGIFCFFLALYGWGVLILYSWVLLVLCGIVLFLRYWLIRSSSILESLASVVIVAVLVLVLSGIGCGLLLIRKEKICNNANYLISQVQQYRRIHGIYPDTGLILDNPMKLKYIFSQGQPDNGLNIDEINHNDVIFYMRNDGYRCVVPVTKEIPLSITRFYVLERSAVETTWTYKKLIWTWW